MQTLSVQSLRSITETVLNRAVDWIALDDGFCECPAEGRHTNRSGKRDCRVYLDWNPVPSIYCQHQSCRAELEEINRMLRSAIGKAERGANPQIFRCAPSPADFHRQRERQRIRERAESLRKRAAAYLPIVLKEHACTIADFWERSPYRLSDDGASDWRPLLELFPPDAVIWIGSKFDSANEQATDEAKARASKHFRTVAEWLNESDPPGPFTCPTIFKAGSHSRSNDNVIRRAYLVIESDTLSKDDCCALFRFIAQRLKLRAIVDTAGKSLHGWFEPPATPEDFEDLKAILPAMQCDPALFKLSQPCRLPGAMRDGKRQHLVYLALGGVR